MLLEQFIWEHSQSKSKYGVCVNYVYVFLLPLFGSIRDHILGYASVTYRLRWISICPQLLFTLSPTCFSMFAICFQIAKSFGYCMLQLTSQFSKETILDKLSQLNIYKSPGPDSFHPRYELCEPLYLIFSTSYSSAKLPADWRTANITAGVRTLRT